MNVSIEFPKNRKEITDRMKNDVRAELGENSNPFLRNSALGSMIFGMAARIFDFFSQLKFLLVNMFPDTASGSFLERWGSYVKIGRIPASGAEGFITINGSVAGTEIPNATQFQSSTQVQYSSEGASVVFDLLIPLGTTITRVGNDAIVQTSLPHGLASNIRVTISGVDQPEYNGTFVITVTDVDQFTYVVTGNPATPATGIITIATTIAQVKLISVDFGEASNLGGGEAVTLTTPIVGVNNSGFVQFDGIVGGENSEDDADLRDRILDRYQNPVSFFNVAQIEQKVKTVAGVTRVFVQEITPEPGAITVFFVKDNDPSIIPDTIDRRRAKIAIFEIKPAHVDGGPITPVDSFDPSLGDIKVPPLKEKKIDFAFISVTPDTESLRQAITNNLDQLFRRENNIGEPISQFAYECAIFNSFDDAGDKVTAFQLSAPAGDIIVEPDEIATFGIVTFP